MKLAILKPDHLGDLVLSSPAIRAMISANTETTLFVSSRTATLAQVLFPNVTIESFDLPHLSKEGGATACEPGLQSFDAVAVLRRDGVLTPSWARSRARRFSFYVDSHTVHQTVLDYGVAREFAPAYDIDALYYGSHGSTVAAKASAPRRKIGLAIGSGFYANSWPVTAWIDLGRRLAADDRSVTVLHGPSEAAAARIIGEAVPNSRRVQGGADYGAFLAAVDDLDLVVASDGGTAHLCSLRAPILSIFGPSPVYRYAPNGIYNYALTRLLDCSPCCQYAAHLVNGCLSVECMSTISPEDVHLAATENFGSLEPGARALLSERLHLIAAPSWHERESGLRARELEMSAWMIGAIDE